ncbi:MAG: anaerobic sulfite reductase subunit AsrB [Clostridiales bacterium]|nr:anaerobic sulfite reductase subunit AsrB [Clostridiales bacterium]
MENCIRPVPCEILKITKESTLEYTFRVKTDMDPDPGQFMQLSIPKVGEAPISVSAKGEGWLEFTIRSVGKVTDEIFLKEPGDQLCLRGPYGHGWPMEELTGKHVVVITGGTGLAPVRMMLNLFASDPDLVKSVTLISGFKNSEGIIFKQELDAWRQNEKFTTWYTLDEESYADWNTGFVTEFVDKVPYDQFDGNYAVVIVGPPPMMKFTGLAAVKAGVPEEKIWMSFERKMSCAVGKCGHCRIDETYVCLDGPVFPYTKAKYLVD